MKLFLQADAGNELAVQRKGAINSATKRAAAGNSVAKKNAGPNKTDSPGNSFK
ncbi:MAG: hypothetical protein KBC17_04020 [Candidatus Pacebacteria bacterium]|nr:hypothetical protein [Candidatus Paceibacterota bacterium]